MLETILIFVAFSLLAFTALTEQQFIFDSELHYV